LYSTEYSGVLTSFFRTHPFPLPAFTVPPRSFAPLFSCFRLFFNMSAIGGLQERGEEIELLVGPVLAPGMPDAEDQDVDGGYAEECREQGHHQAASVLSPSAII
jgi:hypothetical protein